MKKMKAILLLMVGFAILPSHADYKAQSAPVPWPWPWSICSIKWDELSHRYTLPDVPEGSTLSITTSRADNSGFVNVHVRRSDSSGGVHSDGVAFVPERKANVVVMMTPQRDNIKPYAIRIGVYLYESYHMESCQTDRLATVMSIEPLRNQEPSGRPDYNYMLNVISSKQ